MNYWFYVSLQTLGGFLLLWKALPTYRDMIAGGWAPAPNVTAWPFIIIILLQVPYWLGRKLHPVFKNHGPKEIVLGHVVLFAGRMMYVFVGGVFAALFYTQMVTLRHTPFRAVLIVLLLFSMFCYTMELDKLSRLLMHNKGEEQ